MAFNPDSRLGALRMGTHDAHARMETVPALSRLLATDLTRHEYVSILRHLHAFHSHAEPAIAAGLETIPEAAAMLDGTRPQALAEDLSWFGAKPAPPPRLPPLTGSSAALGALYVIEGSGLGGRVIARHLTTTLGVADGAGGSFYCRQDADTARRRWNRLTAMLEAVDVDTGAMVAGAQALFRSLEDRLRTITAVAEEVAP